MQICDCCFQEPAQTYNSRFVPRWEVLSCPGKLVNTGYRRRKGPVAAVLCVHVPRTQSLAYCVHKVMTTTSTKRSYSYRPERHTGRLQTAALFYTTISILRTLHTYFRTLFLSIFLCIFHVTRLIVPCGYPLTRSKI